MRVNHVDRMSSMLLQHVLYHDMFTMRPKQDAMGQWLNDCQSSLDDGWRNWFH